MVIPLRSRFWVYLVLLVIIVLTLWILSGLVFAYFQEENPSEVPLNAFYEQPRIPLTPLPTKNDELINQLIECESGGNPEAIGDEGKAIGILQFHYPTFKRYCVERYDYRNDITDPEIQYNCAREMLAENFDNVLNWSCYLKIKK